MTTQLLTPLQQFDLTLPRQGRRALFRASNKSNTFFDTNEELLAECQRLVDEPGVYMAVCSFGAEDKRTQANAQFCRSLYIDIDAGAEKYARAPTKAYPDAKDALAALVAFCKTIDLKPSLIISSGMGLHVYWVLDDDYPTAAVRPVMDKLKQACAVLDLRADPNVTADTARVLRPVGSLYSKDSDGTERRVTAIKITDAVHSLSDVALKMLPYAPQDATPKIDLPNINDDILTYPDNDHSLAKGLEHCGALKEIADAGGNVPEPFWRLMLGVAKACNVDGSEIAHKVSENDPRYDAANLDGYLDRWTTGPALCTSFAEHSSACKGCPHNGRIKSPIVLCRVDVVVPDEPAPEPEVEAPETVPEHIDEPIEERRPELFDIPQAGGVYFRPNQIKTVWQLHARIIEDLPDPADPSGKKTVKMWVDHIIANRLFWLESCTKTFTDNDGIQIELVVIASPNSKEQHRSHISASVLADNATFAKKMLACGVVFTADRRAVQLCREYLINEYQRVQNKMKFTVRSHYGFDWHDGQFLCAHGDIIIRPKSLERTIVNTRLDGPILGRLKVGCLPNSPQGVWPASVIETHVAPAARRYAEFIAQHYQGPEHAAHRFALALGLGSLYLIFTDANKFYEGAEIPPSGGVVSLVGESGRGKTALQRLISAAFGVGGNIIGGDESGATKLSRSAVASAFAFYPLVLDEVSQNDPERQASEVQMLANGTSRLRATKDGSLSQAGGNWNLITLMSTNTSQVSAMMGAKNASAMLARLIEIDFDGVPLDSPESVRAQVSAYEDAASVVFREGGAIGMLLGYLAVRQGKEWMSEKALSIMSKLETRYGLKSDARYYARMAAACFLTARMLRQTVGIELISEDELHQHFEAATARLSLSQKSIADTPDEILSRMLSDLSQRIVITKDSPTPGRRTTTPVLNINNLQTPLVGRQVNDERRVYLTVNAVNHWCTNNRVPLDKLMTNLRLNGRLAISKAGEAYVRRSLTCGVAGLPDLPRVRCYAFNISMGSEVFDTKPVEEDQPDEVIHYA